MHVFWRRYKMFTNYRCLCIRVTDSQKGGGRAWMIYYNGVVAKKSRMTEYRLGKCRFKSCLGADVINHRDKLIVSLECDGRGN